MLLRVSYKILNTEMPFLIENSSLLVKYCSANFQFASFYAQTK